MLTVTVSLIALSVGIASLVMSFARTGPEDAAANLARWVAAFKSSDFQSQFRVRVVVAIFRSPVWRVISVIIAIGGVLGNLYSFYKESQKGGPPPLAPITTAAPRISPPAAPPVMPQKPTTKPDWSNDEIAIRVDLWQTVEGDINRFVNEYNRADLLQRTWSVQVVGSKKSHLDALSDVRKNLVEVSLRFEKNST